MSPVLALVLVLVLAHLTYSQSCENADAEVLILGAGISGITAAKTLHDNGITNFTILEQRDRIGGRINSSRFAGATIELGAQWIVGADPSAPLNVRNPIIRLAQRCGLQYRQSRVEGTFTVYNREGVDITNDTLMTFTSQYLPALAGATQQLVQLQRKDPLGDQDLSLDAAFRLSGWNARNPLQQWVEYFAVDLIYGAPADVLSFRRSLQIGQFVREDFGNNTGNFLVTDPRGFMFIVDCMAEDFLATDDPRLHLNTTVTSIQWSDECVCASVIENGDSNQYCAPYAIFTFSVGVIENNVVQFIPPLPYSRLFAIHQYSLSNFLKIWIAFNETFWDEDVEWIGYADEINGREYFPIFTPLGTHLPGRPNIIEAFLTGETALRIAQQDIELTKLQIAEVLRRMYGQRAREPTDIIMHDFITNPYFYGDYRIAIPGVDLRNYQTLNSPLGRMYFAGEMTARYHSSVHGSYLSGVDQANAVLRQIMASHQVNLQFINDSPRVVGNTISAEFVTSGPVASLICGLTRQPTQDCSSGQVNYTSLHPGSYTLRVTASNGRDDRRVWRRALYIASDPSECSVHLINRGIVVRGSTASVEFTGSGSFSSFSCRLDREEFLPCSTPHELSNLGVGTHRLRIRSRDCEGSINQISVKFSV